MIDKFANVNGSQAFSIGGVILKDDLAAPVKEKYNRKYKDSLFTALFKDKRYAKLLYESLFPHSDPVCEDDIEIITLENIFTFDRYNDACMLVKDVLLVLTEHQATLNPNMPTRLLLYVAEEYKRLFANDDGKKLYGTKLVEIPAPKFYVVYTGTGAYPGSLQLSNAFMSSTNALELTVEVIDSNNAKGILGEFVSLSQEIDSSVKGLDAKAKAAKVKEVVQKYQDPKYLISAFLNEKGDVVDMINGEITFEDILEVRMEESREEGRGEGREQGMIEMARKYGASNEEIIGDLMHTLSYNYERARRALRKYDQRYGV